MSEKLATPKQCPACKQKHQPIIRRTMKFPFWVVVDRWCCDSCGHKWDVCSTRRGEPE